MNLIRRRALAALIAMPALARSALAQSDHRVRLIVPTSAGGATDATARALQTGLATAWGAPVVVENMPGASGIVGLQAVARASPNDLTLGVITNSLVILPSVMQSFPFEVARDFTPIAMLGSIPMAVAASPKLGVTNARELIALLKRTPDALNFGSSGAGSISHLTTEMFLEDVGATARHIPFQGPAPMTSALLGGQIDFASQGLPVFQPYFKGGALRPIAVCSSKRSSVAPDVPTFAEQGHPNLLVEAWVTLIGPKGMDPALVKKLRDGAALAFESPASRESLAKQGTVVVVTSSEEAKSTITRDLNRYAALVKKIGLVPQ